MSKYHMYTNNSRRSSNKISYITRVHSKLIYLPLQIKNSYAKCYSIAFYSNIMKFMWNIKVSKKVHSHTSFIGTFYIQYTKKYKEKFYISIKKCLKLQNI